MKRRVVITGLGTINSLGYNVDEFWAGIREGKSGIGPITRTDVTEHATKIAGEVKNYEAVRPYGQKGRTKNGALYTVCCNCSW